MVQFLYPRGAVYIFENSKAQRVKVGMTAIGVNGVADRLRDVNDCDQNERSLARSVKNTGSTLGHISQS
jgi:hypothetical protein